MALNYQQIFTAIIKADTSNAVTELRKVDGAVTKTTTGATSKFQSFTSAAKANVGAFALGASAAVGAFAIKSIASFQNTALGAGKLRDALGVTAEEASRLQEVADDLGIGVGALESTMGRMNRTAAQTPDKFAAIGAELAKNEDGTTNVTETFLSTVDALNQIPDATVRAQASQEIFGRSWQDIAELVAAGGDSVRESLASVEAGKIVDDAEIERARKFRDTLDNLKGVAEELAIEVGGALVDALDDMAPALQATAEAAGLAVRALGGLFGIAENVGSSIGHALSPWNREVRMSNNLTSLAFQITEAAAASFDKELLKGKHSFQEVRQAALDHGQTMEAANIIALEWKATQDELGRTIHGLTQAETYTVEATEELKHITELTTAVMDEYGRKAHFAADEMNNLRNDYSKLRDELSNRSDFLGIAGAFDDIQTAAEEAYIAAVSGADDSEQKNRDWELSILSAKDQVLAYGESIEGLPERTTTDIIALIDAGKLDEAERRLNNLSRPRDVAIKPFVINTGGGRVRVDEFGNVRGFDDGGVVPGPRGAPQLAMVHGGETILPTHKANMPSTGSVSGVTLNISPGAIIVNGNVSPDAVVDSLVKHVRQNGPGGLRDVLRVA
jgi:murein DD-endopeptidase MepM/ murein hydrolase activator NlpD